jgi:hypothetical protein
MERWGLDRNAALSRMISEEVERLKQEDQEAERLRLGPRAYS